MDLRVYTLARPGFFVLKHIVAEFVTSGMVKNPLYMVSEFMQSAPGKRDLVTGWFDDPALNVDGEVQINKEEIIFEQVASDSVRRAYESVLQGVRAKKAGLHTV